MLPMMATIPLYFRLVTTHVAASIRMPAWLLVAGRLVQQYLHPLLILVRFQHRPPESVSKSCQAAAVAWPADTAGRGTERWVRQCLARLRSEHHRICPDDELYIINVAATYEQGKEAQNIPVSLQQKENHVPHKKRSGLTLQAIISAGHVDKDAAGCLPKER